MSTDKAYWPGIAALIDLAVQIDRDRQKTEGQLRGRDREIGRKLSPLKGSPRKQVLAWLSLVCGRDRPRLGARVARALRVGTVLLGLAGLVLGWISAAAVYYYDGSRPVNVIHILAVFVAAQLILVLLLLLTLVPRSILRWIPGAGPGVETLRLLSPGRIQKLASRHLPVEYRQRAAALFGTSRAHRVLFGRVEKWMVTRSSQVFASAFNGGALLSCLYLILFSDLAFAWSTTLQVTAEQIHSLTALLSAPWSTLLPDAAPSAALIEASRYYRLKGGLLPSTGAGPAMLGGWWPFLVLCMFCYGLLPRLALWAFSGWRLRSAGDHAFLHLPGVMDLLDRMNLELVETRSKDAESSLVPPPSERSGVPRGPQQGTTCTLINWGQIDCAEERLSRSAVETWSCSPAAVLTAGGANSLAQDEEVIDRAVKLSGRGGVIVFVKAWEPPLEEFVDFLGELRAALPGDAPIVVAPLGMDGDPAHSRLEVWRTRMQSLGDPWLSVQQPGGVVS